MFSQNAPLRSWAGLNAFEIKTENYFCVRHKNRRKHIRINLLLGTSTKFLHIKTKFASHKQYPFGIISSRNVKKTHTDQIMIQVFSLCLKRTVSQTFESKSCQKRFRKYVCYWCNLLRWMYFIPSDNWKTFFIQM